MRACPHACVSVTRACLSWDPHICDLSPVSLNLAAAGASSTIHINFNQLIAYHPPGDSVFGIQDR